MGAPVQMIQPDSATTIESSHVIIDEEIIKIMNKPDYKLPDNERMDTSQAFTDEMNNPEHIVQPQEVQQVNDDLNDIKKVVSRASGHLNDVVNGNTVKVVENYNFSLGGIPIDLSVVIEQLREGNSEQSFWIGDTSFAFEAVTIPSSLENKDSEVTYQVTNTILSIDNLYQDLPVDFIKDLTPEQFQIQFTTDVTFRKEVESKIGSLFDECIGDDGKLKYDNEAKFEKVIKLIYSFDTGVKGTGGLQILTQSNDTDIQKKELDNPYLIDKAKDFLRIQVGGLNDQHFEKKYAEYCEKIGKTIDKIEDPLDKDTKLNLKTFQNNYHETGNTSPMLKNGLETFLTMREWNKEAEGAEKMLPAETDISTSNILASHSKAIEIIASEVIKQATQNQSDFKLESNTIINLGFCTEKTAALGYFLDPEMTDDEMKTFVDKFMGNQEYRKEIGQQIETMSENGKISITESTMLAIAYKNSVSMIHEIIKNGNIDKMNFGVLPISSVMTKPEFETYDLVNSTLSPLNEYLERGKEISKTDDLLDIFSKTGLFENVSKENLEKKANGILEKYTLSEFIEMISNIETTNEYNEFVGIWNSINPHVFKNSDLTYLGNSTIPGKKLNVLKHEILPFIVGYKVAKERDQILQKHTGTEISLEDLNKLKVADLLFDIMGNANKQYRIERQKHARNMEMSATGVKLGAGIAISVAGLIFDPSKASTGVGLSMSTAAIATLSTATLFAGTMTLNAASEGGFKNLVEGWEENPLKAGMDIGLSAVGAIPGVAGIQWTTPLSNIGFGAAVISDFGLTMRTQSKTATEYDIDNLYAVFNSETCEVNWNLMDEAGVTSEQTTEGSLADPVQDDTYITPVQDNNTDSDPWNNSNPMDNPWYN